ncbi:putative Zn(II)2Cys6 transcription factor [Thelonectria olida]|uniref:Zn(II)2Cys6 transcription factor n=1 Tax=Thelonectria olida TaxID=1576542 RepID=A0A9P8VR70_9HYPO|nr:putative Zn(II)2Cys6 transcription factor [Thelonectria olida]
MSRQTTPAASRLASRKRLRGACRACHDRKVRCSLSKSGPPCTNCSLDEIECELRVRKSQKTSAAVTLSRQVLPGSFDLSADPDQREASITVVPPPEPEGDTRPTTSESHSAVPGINGIGKPDNLSNDPEGTHAVDSEAEVACSEKSTEPRSNIYRPFRSHFSHFAEDDALNAESLPADTPMYADPKGVCAIANICEPERADRSGHFLLPNGIVSSLDPEDIGYLRLKGAFMFPEAGIRDDLVRTYFHYVHPFFPILDAQDFLSKHESGALDRIGAHLLWSMYLASCNFLEEDVVRAAGFATRKEMKRSIYRKAKVLYDMQYERDRTALIQAVLLMSFCSSDTEDKTGPWHWIGVAISLCQTAGLHRNPHPTASHIPQHRQRLWRLIWWSCVHQDAWFSVGMGRPMRINLDDCDTQLPVPGDSDAMADGLSETLREKYLPAGMPNLSQLFVELIRLAIIQANIMSTHYRARQIRPSMADVVQIEQRISTIHKKANDLISSENLMVYYHACHLALFLQSVRIVLYRPYLLNLSQKGSSSFSQEWCLLMERKAQAATAGFNQILEALITADMILACQAIVCIALVPPMQIHLLNSTSSKPLIATLGQHSLEMCMLVANELRKTYFGAELLHRLFSQAKAQIMNRKTQKEATKNSQPAEAINLETQTPCLSHCSTQSNQNFTDADTIRNLGSTLAGFEGIFSGYDFAMLGSNFDFAFPAALGDDAPPSQFSRWYPDSTDNCFQGDGMQLN